MTPSRTQPDTTAAGGARAGRLPRSARRKQLLGAAQEIFVDWSQNNPAKTTVAPYSLRARPAPTVSTPLTWDEVAAGGSISFTAGEVLDRVEEFGDLWAGVIDDGRRARLTASLVTDE